MWSTIESKKNKSKPQGHGPTHTHLQRRRSGQNAARRARNRSEQTFQIVSEYFKLGNVNL